MMNSELENEHVAIQYQGTEHLQKMNDLNLWHPQFFNAFVTKGVPLSFKKELFSFGREKQKQ